MFPKYVRIGILITVFTLLVLYFIKLFDISYPMTIVTTTRSSELSVVGEGKIDVIPDVAYVDAGVTISNLSTVADVQKNMDEVNNKIIQAMQGLGIKKEDIRTSNYSINPNYSYENNQNNISGYNGNASITVKVRTVSLVTKVIEEVTKAGANQVQGARFDIDKPENYREKARDKAIQNAKDQAQKLAQTLGLRLGKIVNIVESSPNQGPIAYPMMEAKIGMGGGGGAQVEPGTQTITSLVTLYFERK